MAAQDHQAALAAVFSALLFFCPLLGERYSFVPRLSPRLSRPFIQNMNKTGRGSRASSHGRVLALSPGPGTPGIPRWHAIVQQVVNRRTAHCRGIPPETSGYVSRADPGIRRHRSPWLRGPSTVIPAFGATLRRRDFRTARDWEAGTTSVPLRGKMSLRGPFREIKGRFSSVFFGDRRILFLSCSGMNNVTFSCELLVCIQKGLIFDIGICYSKVFLFVLDKRG